MCAAPSALTARCTLLVQPVNQASVLVMPHELLAGVVEAAPACTPAATAAAGADAGASEADAKVAVCARDLLARMLGVVTVSLDASHYREFREYLATAARTAAKQEKKRR